MKMTMYEDLNYQFSLEELYPGELGLMIHKSSLSSIFIKILKLCFYCLKSLNPFFRKQRFPEKVDTLIIISSLNQYRALEKLIDSLSNVLVMSTFPINCENNIVIGNGNCWVSLINMPKLIINMLKQNGFKYKSMIFYFEDYLHTPGVYNHAFKHVKAIKPKSLLVANDHSSYPRSYFRAAQKLGIKTIYTQHAPVSPLFPPLEFTYAFLDGDETLDKYRINGRAHLSDVFLSGSPRFDKIPLIPEINTYDLGVATNILDNKESVLNFMQMLKAKDINFIMRPHPGQPDIAYWQQYCLENQIGYSNPFVDNPITFIASSKRFVVGDSGLHLEVALCKKISYYVNFQPNEASDGYDFVKEGLVELMSEQEVVDALTFRGNEKKSIEKVKYYVANFETEYWGKSTPLIAATINEINSGAEVSQWKVRTGEEKIFEIKA